MYTQLCQCQVNPRATDRAMGAYRSRAVSRSTLSNDSRAVSAAPRGR